MAAKFLQVMAVLLGHSVPRSVLSLLLLASSLLGIFWTILDAAGVPGSPQILGLLAAAVALLVTMLVVSIWLLRWAFLYPAIKAYVRDELAGKVIKNDTTLVTAGIGGTIVLGMVAKALQELGHPISKIIATDLTYNEDGVPEVGKLLPRNFNLTNNQTIIIISYTGTGNALRAIRKRFHIENAPVFSLVVSNAANQRERVEHYLISGSRTIIPWERSVVRNTKA
jgi:hypothetical protein